MADEQTGLGEGPLAGVRVVELASGTGAPFAGMLLAEQGAQTIKVEPPGGDPARGTPPFHVLNRSKQSVTLDVARPDDRDRLASLLDTADLFLTDRSYPQLEALGLGWDGLRARNPRLILASLPAFGSRGPLADLPADEALVQAASGVQATQWRYDEPPVFITVPIAGYAQGIVGAGSVAASLVARRRADGRGDRFELSAYAAVFAFEQGAFVRAEGVIRLSGRANPRGPLPTYRLMKASDDWLFVGALTPAFWASLAVAADIADCLVDPRFEGAPLGMADLSAWPVLGERIESAFLTRPRADWLQILEEADVPRAPALTRSQFMEDPQVVHNGMVVQIDDPLLGPTRQMGVPVRGRSHGFAAPRPAPRAGEHQPLLDELARTGATPAAPPSDDTPARRGPLEGITVLDLGGFIAGANGSMFFADLGADVIKIEGPEGEGWRTSGLGFLGANRGKRGLCIDLKQPDGQALFLDLIERADMLLDNLRAGVLERLNLGWETLRARNPRLIHVSVTGFGPDGPYAHMPGFDPLAQARSGLMRAQGGPDGEPVYLQIAVTDYATALMAAFGALAALAGRDRTGMGDRVETSLLNNGFSVQAGEMITYPGRPADPPGGRDLHGRHALYRVYRTADDYLFLACTTAAQASALAHATGGPFTTAGELLGQPLDGALTDELAARLAQRTVAEWVDALLTAGVPVAPCVPLEQLLTAEHAEVNELFWEADQPRWGRVRQVGKTVRWDAWPMQMQRRAPLIGEHTVAALHDLGVDDDRIERLLAAGTIVQHPGE